MRPLSVREVNTYIKKIFSTDMILSDIEVEGEISNYNHHYSGHRYFSLKDNSGRIKCVMFKGYGQYLKEDLEEGQKVVARGYISIYEQSGEYQLYVKSIESQGLGDLYKKFEELKEKLEKEGLFKKEHKKEIPKMPRKIGIVTSATGAAVEDIINVISRRYPLGKILIYPTLVQGKDAPKQISEGIGYLDKREDVDLIIIGRGGGSIDELFAFNSEDLARSIFKAETPIISAVGHETDFTISDFVADLRAPTPSAAAELAVPNVVDMGTDLYNYKRHLLKTIMAIFRDNKNILNSQEKELKFNNPIYKVLEKRQSLDYFFEKIVNEMKSSFLREKNKVLDLDKKLQVLNPSIGLDKGYGILTNLDGELIKSIESVDINDSINILLEDGEILVRVENIKRGEINRRNNDG